MPLLIEPLGPRLRGTAALLLLGGALPAASAFGQGVAVEGARLVERFLAAPEVTPARYRVLRRLEASCDRFHAAAWMLARVECDPERG